MDPRLGTLDLFRALVQAAHGCGLRVVADLALNYTSDCHPWFRAARRNPDSHYGRFYVWSRDKPDDPRVSAFPDVVPSPWSFDVVAGRWYLHHFFPFQPALNVDNPQVGARLHEVVAFWLDQGVDGLRIDATPYLIREAGPASDHDGTPCCATCAPMPTASGPGRC